MLSQSPTFGDPRLPPRFWAKVRVLENGCWDWIASRNDENYGTLGVASSRTGLAHRFAYEKLIGPIPPGLHIDHLCHNPNGCSGGPTCPHRACVNPIHLEPVTARINAERGGGWPRIRSQQTHCVHRHVFDLFNTYYRRDGTRYCRACHRRSELVRRQKAASREVDNVGSL